jgi:hypothetical protein
MSSNLPSIDRRAQILGGNVMTVHESHARRWVGLPYKTQVDSDAQVRRDDRGKAAYTSVLQSVVRAVAEAFSGRAIKALLETYPLAFDLEPAS